MFWMPFISGVARHLLTCIAGVFVARGLISNTQVDTFVGSILFCGGLLWSIWVKLIAPEAIAYLHARIQQQNIQAKKTLASATPAAAAGLAAIMAMTGPAAHAQGLFAQPPAKVRVVHAKPRALTLPNLLQPAATDPLNNLLQQLQQASLTDLQVAIAEAQKAASVTPPTAAATNAAVRAQCYVAISNLITTTTAPLVNTGQAPSPLASVFTNFEKMAQIADNMAPMSSVQLACAPMAQAIRMNTGQLLLGILGGGLSLAKLGVAIP